MIRNTTRRLLAHRPLTHRILGAVTLLAAAMFTTAAIPEGQTPRIIPDALPAIIPSIAGYPDEAVCEEPLIDGSMQMIFVVDARDEVALPLSGTVDCSIYWGDCSSPTAAVAAGDVSHTYARPGEYTIQIDGDLTSFGDGATWTGADMLTSVTTFGTTGCVAFPGAFYGATNLTALPSGVTGVTDISDMLHDATSYNGTELATWDITSLTDASNALDGCGLEPDHYNQIIMSWADQVATNSDLPASITLGADGLWWGNAEYDGYEHADTDIARTYLTDTAGWTFTNDKEAQVIVINTALGSGTDISLSYRSDVTGSVLDCTIYWGDGVSEQYSGEGISTNQEHDYGVDGEYTIHVVGTATHSDANGFGSGTDGRKKLIQVRSFGDVGTYYHFGFQFSPNIEYVPKYLPSTVMRIPGFRGNGIIDTWKIENVALWDVSNINADGVHMYGASEVFGSTGVTDTLILNWSFDYPVAMWSFYRGINNNNIIVSNIDFSNVRDLWNAFYKNNLFDQPFLNTDFRNCNRFEGTFRDDPAFNQNLGDWQLRTAGVDMTGMLNNCGMSVENYSRTIIGWANYVWNGGVPDGPFNVTLGAEGLKYDDTVYGTGHFTDAVTAKAWLTTARPDGAGWAITDAGVAE